METTETTQNTGRELLNDYAAAVTAGDMELWMSLWAESGIQMAPDAPSRSKEQICVAMEPFFDLYDHKMTVDCQDVRLASAWGFVRGEFTDESKAKDGSGKASVTGKFLTIVEKQDDGGWKIVCDRFNYNAPAYVRRRGAP